MAKVKVVGTRLSQNLNNESFNNTTSQTIFSFGRFGVTSNFDGRQFIDYDSELTTFVKPITLETLNLNDIQSEIVLNKTTSVVLNLDNSDFKSFVRFGSAYEFLRISIEDIILKYPASIFIDRNNIRGGGDTFNDLKYDATTDITEFKVYEDVIVNDYEILYKEHNTNLVTDDIKNLSTSYLKYEIWIYGEGGIIKTPILDFTGSTKNRQYITIKTLGNPFEEYGNDPVVSYHVRPKNIIFEEFREQLTNFQKYILSNRVNDTGFQFIMKDPVLMNNGEINYNDNTLIWNTSDGYNLDFSGANYRQFLERLLNIGNKYDTIKTDLISRFLTPTSIKTYDLTQEGKVNKLLRVYGREFDQMREFIDSLAYVNSVTYDKINNAPDQIILNLAKTMGWDSFSLVNERELVETLLTIDNNERNLNTELLPVEIDIELWRRIIMNTNYLWKSKGTREAIKAIFLMIGIPEPFINITEYIYTVDGRIDPRKVELQPIDFGSQIYPFDNDGFPKAPPETSNFYFQISGDSDGGVEYMNNFRKAGFNLKKRIDNKKSWVQDGNVIRKHHLNPEYYQEDSKLVLNTKEVDIALDASRGIEYDVYEYIKKDWDANSTGATVPYSYVNVSLDATENQTVFPLPPTYDDYQKVRGDLEVRFNGILLNGPKEYDPNSGTTSGITYSDYVIDPVNKTFTLLTASANTSDNHRDVIQATFIYSGETSPITGVTIQYVVTRIKKSSQQQIIKLPNNTSGHVQLTINGIALTRGTGQFNADYVVNPNDSSELVIQNQAVNDYLNNVPNSFIQVAYVEVTGSTSIEARNEIHRVDSFNSSKFYYNSIANRFVYLMNYKAKNVNNIKVLIDGIGLEPKKDYYLNSNNPYEIYLPKGIKIGSVISVYYLIGGDEFLNPVINDVFGLGDISNLSFLEFLELVERKMINARTRKTISNFNGGWYPTLLRIYNEYLRRSNLDNNNPLQSNGYTFQNLFPFLTKYNTFFQKFIVQLLPATIINKKSGLLVRNTLFSRQKFMYKRGVAFSRILPEINTSKPSLVFGNENIEVSFNNELNYIGDDGSVFLVPQEDSVLTPSVQTRVADSVTDNSIVDTGGVNVLMWNSVTSYGIEYKKKIGNSWNKFEINNQTLSQNRYTLTISNLDDDTDYVYRAFIRINNNQYNGDILEIKTNETQLPDPTLKTTVGTAVTNDNGISRINNTGGYFITRGDEVISYGMLYRLSSESNWTNFDPNPPYFGNITNGTFSHDISQQPLSANTEYEYVAYINVDGVNYYGNIITTTTPPTPIYKPTVTTGDSDDITDSSLWVTGSTITNDGGDNITQYGVLYTQNSVYGSSNSLIYDNINNGVIVNTGSTTPSPIPFDYNINITGLTENTSVWFRSFAINSEGVGYGIGRRVLTGEIYRNFNLIIEIFSQSNYGFVGDVFVVNASDVNDIFAIDKIENPVISHTNQFTLLPNIDYEIIVKALEIVDFDNNNQTVTTEMNYEWYVDGNLVSNTVSSPIFTNQSHDIRVNIIEPIN